MSYLLASVLSLLGGMDTAPPVRDQGVEFAKLDLTPKVSSHICKCGIDCKCENCDCGLEKTEEVQLRRRYLLQFQSSNACSSGMCNLAPRISAPKNTGMVQPASMHMESHHMEMSSSGGGRAFEGRPVLRIVTAPIRLIGVAFQRARARRAARGGGFGFCRSCR